jgi:hypothetical protein
MQLQVPRTFLQLAHVRHDLCQGTLQAITCNVIFELEVSGAVALKFYTKQRVEAEPVPLQTRFCRSAGTWAQMADYHASLCRDDVSIIA